MLKKLLQLFFLPAAELLENIQTAVSDQKVKDLLKDQDISNPAIGLKSKYEKVREIKLEVLLDSWKLKSVLKAMLTTHPYEEPAYDIYPLENDNVNYGAGAIGNFEKSLSVSETLSLISRKLTF